MQHLHRYERDDAEYKPGGSVPTDCWVLKRWMGHAGAETDETALPPAVIRMAPNVVHKCLGSCRPEATCIHGIYRGLTPKFVADLAGSCGCTPAQRQCFA
jgi:hypothetical protein